MSDRTVLGFSLGYLSGALTALLAVAVGIILSGCGLTPRDRDRARWEEYRKNR